MNCIHTILITTTTMICVWIQENPFTSQDMVSGPFSDPNDAFVDTEYRPFGWQSPEGIIVPWFNNRLVASEKGSALYDGLHDFVAAFTSEDTRNRVQSFVHLYKSLSKYTSLFMRYQQNKQNLRYFKAIFSFQK